MSDDPLKINIRQADSAMSLKTWWAVLVIYPFARRLTVWIVNRTHISPNQVTFTAMGLRLLTAVLFLCGNRWGLVQRAEWALSGASER